MQENRNIPQSKLPQQQIDKSLEDYLKLMSMSDLSFKDYNFPLNSSAIFGAFPFFDSFNPSDIHSFNLLSQTVQENQSSYPQTLNWSSYLNSHLAMAEKKVNDDMSSNFYMFDKDSNNFRDKNNKILLNQPNPAIEQVPLATNLIMKKEEDNEAAAKKENNKKERCQRMKKSDKAKKKLNLKNTYINKINLLISDEASSSKQKDSKKGQNESCENLNAAASNKFPLDKFDKDPVKRVKSYNINPEFSQGDQKLMRNRESARNSRKRKKIYIELLENKVSELSSELSKAKSLVFENQRSIQSICVQSKFNEQNFNSKQCFEALEGALQNKQSFNQLQTILENIKSKTETSAKQRRTTLGFYFDQIIEMMLPVHMRYLLWAAIKNQDIFTINKNNLEESKANEENQYDWSQTLLSLGLNTTEKDEILLNKNKLIQEKNNFERLARGIHNVKALFGNEIVNFETNVYRELQNILTADQYAKLLLFLEKQEEINQINVNKFSFEKDDFRKKVIFFYILDIILKIMKDYETNENYDMYSHLERRFDMLRQVNSNEFLKNKEKL